MQYPAGTSLAASSTESLGTAFGIGGNAPLVFTVVNTGTGTLNLGLVSTDTAVNCSIDVTQPLASALAPADTTTFSLLVTVLAAGPWSFNVTVASDSPTFVYSVGGTASVAAPPAMQVVALGQVLSNGQTVSDNNLAPAHAFVIAVTVKNLGGQTLTLSVPTPFVGGGGGSLSVRDAAPASIAPGDAAVFTLTLVSPNLGNTTANWTVALTNNDPSTSGTFSFTLSATTLASQNAIYLTTTSLLYSSPMDGSGPKNVLLSPSPTNGVGSGYFHRGTYAVYVANALAASGQSPYDVFLAPLPTSASAPPPPQNLSASITTTAACVCTTSCAGCGRVSQLAVAGNNVLFATNSGAPPSQLYAVAVTATTGAAPVLLSPPTPAVGAQGATGFIVSPDGNKVAYLGDFETKNLPELYVSSVQGGSAKKVSAPYTPATFGTQFNTIEWASDSVHLTYVLRNQPSAFPAIDLYWADSDGPAASATKINGSIVGTGWGVQASQISTSVTHVFYSSSEAFTGAGGNTELYVLSIVNGVPQLPAVGVNGASVPGTTNLSGGVGAFAIDSRGERALFNCNSGTANAQQLYFSSISGSTPTTTASPLVTATSGVGVALPLGRGTFVSDARAIYTDDATAAGRRDLYTVDLTSAPGTFAPSLISNAATVPYPVGSAGVSNVLVSADGASVAFMSDQDTTPVVNAKQLFASPLVAPAQARLGSTGKTVSALSGLVGDSLFFVQEDSAGTAKPNSLFANSLVPSVETAVSGVLSLAGTTAPLFVTQVQGYTTTRAFYVVSDSSGTANLSLWAADSAGVTPAAPVELSTLAGVSVYSFATGAE